MEDGNTLKDHLTSAERQRPGTARGHLNPGRFPVAAQPVWEWYLDIASCRQYGGMGTPLPISHAEIWAWCQLHGITLEPWHIRTIRLLDGVHLRAISAKGEDILKERQDGR